MHTIETKVYTFDELDDDAKEKARDWYREGALDYEWWDSCYEMVKEIGAVLGFEDMEPQFSGCDGASFSARWRKPTTPVKAMKALKFMGENGEKLVGMARDMWEFVRHLKHADLDELDGSHVTCYGRSVHANSMRHDNETLLELARDLAHWLYKTLESEHDYLMSDEQVDESILCNEYTFTASGRRFG